MRNGKSIGITVLAVGLVMAMAAQGWGQGQGRERCERSGQKVSTKDNLASIVSKSRGGTFLLLRGTHKLKSNMKFKDGRVTVKPYDCEKVTIQTQGRSIQLADRSVLAGLKIDGRSSRYAIVANGRDFEIRNNEIIGKDSAIRLASEARDAKIVSNAISNPRGKNPAIRLSGRNVSNVQIKDNRIFDCGEDCFQPQNTKSFTFQDNLVEGPVKENLVDVKELFASSVISGNTFECGDRMSGGCILVHGAKANPSSVRLTVEDNVMLGCSPQNDRVMQVGRNRVANRVIIKNNQFSNPDSNCELLKINACKNCVVERNNFTRGIVNLKGSSEHGRPQNLIFRNNKGKAKIKR